MAARWVRGAHAALGKTGWVRDSETAWREISRQELMALQNILTDLFRGEVVDNVALSVRALAPPVVCG